MTLAFSSPHISSVLSGPYPVPAQLVSSPAKEDVGARKTVTGVS